MLSVHGVDILSYDSLAMEDADYLRVHYHDNVFPLISPQSIDPAHAFPFISNHALNLLVEVGFLDQEGRTSLARVKVPTSEHVPRFIKLPGRNLR